MIGASGHHTAAPLATVVGARFSNALSGGTRPERALVFMGLHAGASSTTITTPLLFGAYQAGRLRNGSYESRGASLVGP